MLTHLHIQYISDCFDVENVDEINSVLRLFLRTQKAFAYFPVYFHNQIDIERRPKLDPSEKFYCINLHEKYLCFFFPLKRIFYEAHRTNKNSLLSVFICEIIKPLSLMFWVKAIHIFVILFMSKKKYRNIPFHILPEPL